MDEKSAYRQNLKARLNQRRTEIDKLEAKSVEASADARMKIDDQIKELRKQQDAASEKLKELDDASGEAWKDFKRGIEKAWDDLGAAEKKATERLV